ELTEALAASGVLKPQRKTATKRKKAATAKKSAGNKSKAAPAKNAKAKRAPATPRKTGAARAPRKAAGSSARK
ncbi:MAG: hypothetical protein AAGA95_09630, partial [Pseudomonadota bacterium]